MQSWMRTYGSQEYYTLEGDLQAEGLDTMEIYITRLQNMVTQYTVMRLIFDLYMEAEWRPGSQVPMQWW